MRQAGLTRTLSLKNVKASLPFYSLLVRLKGIGPLSHPWQGRVLPLNHNRNKISVPQGGGGNKVLCVILLTTNTVLAFCLLFYAVAAKAATSAVIADGNVPLSSM